jgi:hypothetical protein
MAHKLTRREFLKLSSIAMGVAAFPTLHAGDWRLAQAPSSLGRVTRLGGAQVLDRPNRLGTRVGQLKRDDVVEVYRAVVGEGFYPHNHVWFEIPQGYVYSSLVQPVKNELQKPVSSLPLGGFFAEVSVPLTKPKAKPDSADSDVSEVVVPDPLYYSAVLQIDDIATDAGGGIWYHVAREQYHRVDGNEIYYNFWANGQHMRIVQPEEITPISPDVTDKHIVADVSTNWLSAYEGKTEVYRTRIASGASFFEPDGSEHAGINAGGIYQIYTKRISRHMVGGTYPTGYNLPGVAWVSYWHNGAAIHSTYWHNDYGHPRSHGCLNCTPEAAKWLFRWTTPDVAYLPGNITITGLGGTNVDIAGVPPPLQDDSNG